MVGLRASNTQHVLHYRGAYDLRPFAPVRTWLLQEWLRTAALAKRTRDASSMRARLSLFAQGFRGVGQGGRSPRVSQLDLHTNHGHP
jgi:hypothetical protein